MVISHNISALNTYKSLGVAGGKMDKSMEKLSSGYRINRAGDDAAGLSISEKMRSQIRGLNQASTNAENGISMIQTAEGGLNETHSILQRIRELAVQSATDTNASEDREALQAEVLQLTEEIQRIAEDTEFNGMKILDGSKAKDPGKVAVFEHTVGVDEEVGDFGEVDGYVRTVVEDGTDTVVRYTAEKAPEETLDAGEKLSVGGVDFGLVTGTGVAPDPAKDNSVYFHVGANKDQVINVEFKDMSAVALGIGELDGDGIKSVIDVTTREGANNALGVIDAAIKSVSQERSKYGAIQNRLEYTINNLDTTAENMQAAESTIRDVDMAEEMMEYTKNSILQQAAQAMLVQANARPQQALQLLQ